MTDRTPKKQAVRRRRANVKGGRKHRHEVWVTPEEEARLLLLAEAQRVTIPRLLVESTLSDGRETPTQRRDMIAVLFALRRVVAGMANNVNQIARVANTYGRTPLGTADALDRIAHAMARIDETIDRLALG